MRKLPSPQPQIKGQHCASMDDAWVRDVDGHVDEECANIAKVEADYVLTSSTPAGTRRQYNNVDHLICNTELPEPPKMSPRQNLDGEEFRYVPHAEGQAAMKTSGRRLTADSAHVAFM